MRCLKKPDKETNQCKLPHFKNYPAFWKPKVSSSINSELQVSVLKKHTNIHYAAFVAKDPSYSTIFSIPFFLGGGCVENHRINQLPQVAKR